MDNRQLFYDILAINERASLDGKLVPRITNSDYIKNVFYRLLALNDYIIDHKVDMK